MPLSVLTLNLWNDAGPWPERATRIREWIDRLDPDLIGFQEALRADGRDQVAEPGDFGNAVASRFPITQREATLLPDAGDGERRSALAATLDSPLGPNP